MLKQKGCITKNLSLLLGRDANVTVNSQWDERYTSRVLISWMGSKGIFYHLQPRRHQHHRFRILVDGDDIFHRVSMANVTWQHFSDEWRTLCTFSILKIPPNTEQHVEVKLLSLFYPNNLMNHFVNKKFPGTVWLPFYKIKCVYLPEGYKDTLLYYIWVWAGPREYQSGTLQQSRCQP